MKTTSEKHVSPTIHSYQRGWCGINTHFAIIWTLTDVWMLRFSGDDGTQLEHCTSSGYPDMCMFYWVGRYPLWLLGTMTLTFFIRFEVDHLIPASPKLMMNFRWIRSISDSLIALTQYFVVVMPFKLTEKIYLSKILLYSTQKSP